MLKPNTHPRIAWDTLDEAALVGFARQGQRDAFRVIMQRSNQRLFRVARGIVHDDAEAEDALQQAYTDAFAKFDSFRGDSSLLTWLTRITLNEARGRLRRRRMMVGLDQIEVAQMAGAQVFSFPSGEVADNPEGAAARSEIRRLIERAVDELPEAFRVVFIMRDIQECDVEETAAALSLRPETVKTRLHRARRLLRKALDAQLASTMTGAFPFLGARCQRITDLVLERLAAQHGWTS